MDVQVEKTGSYLRKLSVTIPAGEVEQAFEKAYRKVTKAAHVPGFRPGKVPRGLIDKRYGSQIQSEVQNQLVEETLFRAMDESKVDAVAMPKLQLGSLARGDAFSYTAEVEVRPEINLQKYEGLGAPKIAVEIAEAEVTGELDALRKQSAQLVPVMLRDVVQEGDVVLIDYEGSIGGVPFQGGKSENALVEIGGEGYIPGFAEGLVGAKVPGDRTISVTFPDDYSAEHLAGKEASFRVALKELKTRELPKLDDEFAKDMGEESLEKLRAKIEENIRSRKQREADGTRRRAVLEALVATNPFELPPSMVESQADRMLASAAARIERMVGQRVQLTQEQVSSLRDDSMKDAEFQVRSGLLLLEVGKAAKLEVGDAEIDAEVDKMASQVGDNADRLRSFYEQPERRDEIKYRLLEDKVVAYLLERSTETAPEAAPESTETSAAPAP